MALFDIFNISGSGMAAQSVRLNTTASNIANVDSVASNTNEVYRAKHAVFESILKDAFSGRQVAGGGVAVTGIFESEAPAVARYQPENPLANDDGYVFAPNINMVEEMANMISASRSYQSNVQVATMTKHLLTRTLSLGQ